VTDLAAALSLLIATLERIEAPYVIGGSLASSSHGVWRATKDVDILVAIGESLVDQLAAALGPDWYADPEAMREGIRAGRAFNLIHIPTSYKFDIFPATTSFHDSELQRAETMRTVVAGGTVVCPVATAEDILVAKLQWFQAGGEVSERQWSDILGLLAVNPQLDFEYVRTWAGRLGVASLLARATAGNSTG
jgi:hypothetical protein